ncbi:MAG: hypothetical protein ACREJU_04245, partial [Nitrospiraceae bacterium]
MNFPLKHVNVVAYLTAPDESVVPRLTYDELIEFLGGLRLGGRFHSQEEDRRNRASRLAEESRNDLRAASVQSLGYLDDSTVRRVLAGLRNFFRDYKLFVVPPGEPKDSRKFESFLEFVRASSRHHAVLLKPDYAASLGVLNPFL